MQNKEESKVKSWITEVFKNREFEKLDIVFPDYDTTGGFAAEMLFADVIGLKAGNKERYELTIKKNKDSEIALDTLNLRRGYANEVYLYSKILPQFQLLAREKKSKPFENIPHCYGTIDRDNSYVVIMENLKPKGYRTHMLEEHQNLSHVKLVLTAYAKWHAFSFALKDQKPEVFEKLKNDIKAVYTKEDKIIPILISSVRNELGNAIQIYRDKNYPIMVSKLTQLYDTYEEQFYNYLTCQNEECLVIRHGDCWNNNFLFHYNDNDGKPDNVIIIDWQVGGLSSPVCDIIFYLFYCCTRTELEQMDELLKFYYQNLSQKIRELGSDPEKCFPWDMCLQSFKRYVPIGIAGVTASAKMSQRDNNTEFDISDAFKDGNFSGVFGKEMKNPEKFFERINGIFQLSVERSYI